MEEKRTPLTLEERIAELENEIKRCWRLHDEAEDKEEKRELRGLIKSSRDNLDKLLIQQSSKYILLFLSINISILIFYFYSSNSTTSTR